MESDRPQMTILYGTCTQYYAT